MRPFFLITLFLICLLFSPLSASEISLREKLGLAKTGSYLVTEQNKTCTFLHINERGENYVILEEVVISAAQFARYQTSWRDWFERGAPGHTSWTLSQVNLETGTLEEIFSFPHEGWVENSEANHFISTLLNLSFNAVPDNKRRRIGLPPGYGKPDHRPLWTPILFIDGTPFKQVPFSVWKARWPGDGSELSYKVIEVYLPEEHHSSDIPDYPTYFPTWLEVEGKFGNAKIRVIDAGMGARSPKPRMPHRMPKLLNNGQLNENGFSLAIEAPRYFKEFSIIAEHVDACLGKTIVMPCMAIGQGETLSLFIPRSELDKWLEPGESYLFSIFPKEDPTVCIETETPLLFR